MNGAGQHLLGVVSRIDSIAVAGLFDAFGIANLVSEYTEDDLYDSEEEAFAWMGLRLISCKILRFFEKSVVRSLTERVVATLRKAV